MFADVQIDPTGKGKRSVCCAGGFVLGSALDQAAPGHQPPSLVVTAMAYDAATGNAVPGAACPVPGAAVAPPRPTDNVTRGDGYTDLVALSS